MEITLSPEGLGSESVTYDDIGAQRRRRVMRPVRRRGRPRRKKPLARDPLSVARRKLRNIRSGIKRRLDTIRNSRGDAQKVMKARRESRSMFQDYKRLKQRVERLEKSTVGAEKPQKMNMRSQKSKKAKKPSGQRRTNSTQRTNKRVA
jgi:hypothetical protein